jgi:hypothetical protein
MYFRERTPPHPPIGVSEPVFLNVLNVEVSVYNVYVQTSFTQLNFCMWGGGGVK